MKPQELPLGEYDPIILWFKTATRWFTPCCSLLKKWSPSASDLQWCFRDLYFPNDWWCFYFVYFILFYFIAFYCILLHFISFYWSLGHLCVFGEMFVQIVCKYFHLFCRLPSHSLIVSFAVYIFSLMYSHLPNFAFVAYAYGVISIKLLLTSMSWCSFHMFSSVSFMVVSLMFKSLSQLLFMVCMDIYISFFYMWISNFPNETCWYDYPCPIL